MALIKILAALAVMAFLTSVGVYLLQPSGFGFGFGSGPGYASAIDPTGSAMLHAALFLATLGGIVISSLVAAFRSLPQNQAVRWSRLKSRLFRPHTFIAMCVSPIVYFAVLAALESQVISLLSLLAAFQNGFFWEQIVAARRPEATATG